MKVEFTAREHEEIEEFQEVCNKMNEWRTTPFEELHYVYSFHYTGMGIYVSIKCKELDFERNITDYMSW